MFRLDAVEEVAARHQLHNHIVVAPVLHELENASNVRVVRLFEHLQLVFVELLVDLGHAKTRLLDDLDSARYLGFLMFSEQDYAERARPDFFHLGVVICERGDLLEGLLGLEAEEMICLLLALFHRQATLLNHRRADLGAISRRIAWQHILLFLIFFRLRFD